MPENHNQDIGWRVRRSDVAEFFGVERSTVSDWVSKGLPLRSDGTTSLSVALQWLYCLGPRRSEKFRDDTLAEYIRRLLDG